MLHDSNNEKMKVDQSCLTHEKYYSVLNYALNHYQVPSCNS